MAIGRELDKGLPLWALGVFLVVAFATGAAVLSPVAMAVLVGTAVYVWSFAWKIHRFFALHFGLAVAALVAVPVLRLTAADNTMRVAVPVVLVTTAAAVAFRTRGGSTSRGLLPTLLVFFLLSFIATSLTPDSNEWSFYGLEIAVAFSAVAFARGAAQIRAWSTVIRIFVLVMAAEAIVGFYEVFALSEPIWRGGRILADGSSAWIRNEVVASMPRAQGTFGHPLPFAFGLMIGALLVLRTRVWPVIVRLLLWSLMAGGVFISGSRNAIILLVLLSMLAFVLPSLLPRLHVVVTVAIVGLIVAFPYLVEMYSGLVGSGSVEHRLGALYAVGTLTQSRGVVEIIFGDGSAAATRLFGEGLLQNDGFAAVDNQYVLTLAQNGVLGLFILVLTLIVAWRRASATLRILLLAAIVTGMIFDLFAWPVIGFIMWFLIASAFLQMPDTDLPLRATRGGSAAGGAASAYPTLDKVK